MQVRCLQIDSTAGAMDAPSDADDSRLVINDVAAYNRVFKPKHAIARSPNRLPFDGGSTGVPPLPPSSLQANVTTRSMQKLYIAPSSEGEDEESGPFYPPPQPQSGIRKPLPIGLLTSVLSNVDTCGAVQPFSLAAALIPTVRGVQSQLEPMLSDKNFVFLSIYSSLPLVLKEYPENKVSAEVFTGVVE
ncbi:unnamed protein product [Hydatigera taeniaeformis]|uniref:BESS domain-containing protein n=1 Tax=Hydatigena taeniaeformis TaxID=6205 RepID=A0A0R3WT11_HYDTA|nr:unnamed protein product [Hydatigera taeniaeformis]